MASVEAWKSKSPLIEKLRDRLRLEHKADSTATAYVHWCASFFAWANCGSSDCLDGRMVERYLTHLAVDRNVSASTQNQSFNALLYLFEKVLGKELGKIDSCRAKTSQHVPEWLTKEEVSALIAALDGEWKLMTRLAYGTGMRLMELLRLRVKDLDFANHQIFVRDGKGAKDRLVSMPRSLESDLRAQSLKVWTLHRKDLADGYGSVFLPHALAKKYPNAAKSPGWQYLFPSRSICKAEDGARRRHHLFPNGFQTELRNAAKRAKISKRVHPHILRHSFATHFLENGGNLQMLQSLLGHKNIQTTMIYTHCVDLKAARSPLDQL